MKGYQAQHSMPPGLRGVSGHCPFPVESFGFRSPTDALRSNPLVAQCRADANVMISRPFARSDLACVKLAASR